MKKVITTLLSAMITLIAANAQEETPKQYTVDGFTFEFQQKDPTAEYPDKDDILMLIDASKAIEKALYEKSYKIIVPESITIENGDIHYVKKIGNGVFNILSDITEITLPNSVEIISTNNFNSCPELTQINLGNSLTDIYGISFNDLPKLKTITFPESLRSINDVSFSDLPEMESITFPSSLLVINASCFCALDKLQQVEFKREDTYIDRYSFSGNPLLKTFVFPKYISDPIYYDSFRNNHSLEEVVLPIWLENRFETEPCIYQSAFFDCPSIKRIYNPNVVPPRMIDNNGYIHIFGAGDSDGNGAIDRQKCTLYVPKGSLQAYRDDPSWGCFPNIEEYVPASVEQIFEDNNADVMPGVIQTRNGEIILRDFKNENIRIFSADARLHYNGNVTDTEISLPSGIYIVACGNARMKVRL